MVELIVRVANHGQVLGEIVLGSNKRGLPGRSVSNSRRYAIPDAGQHSHHERSDRSDDGIGHTASAVISWVPIVAGPTGPAPDEPGGASMSGLLLARRFYQHVVGPLLADQLHAAALLGDGSEVLGYDDEVSHDHDFGPRLQVFLPDDRDAVAVEVLLRGLPEGFDGFPVVFADTDRHGGAAHHQVEVTTAASFFALRLGVDPVTGMGVADWLLTPTQVLASLTAGAVFRDPTGALARRRAVLRWYPDDVWRYALRLPGCGSGRRKRLSDGPARPATTWDRGCWPRG
jgi:uncharacterized protein DUF4037